MPPARRPHAAAGREHVRAACAPDRRQDAPRLGGLWLLAGDRCHRGHAAGMYRVTIQVVANLSLTTKQMLRFSICSPHIRTEL